MNAPSACKLGSENCSGWLVNCANRSRKQPSSISRRRLRSLRDSGKSAPCSRYPHIRFEMCTIVTVNCEMAAASPMAETGSMVSLNLCYTCPLTPEKKQYGKSHLIVGLSLGKVAEHCGVLDVSYFIGWLRSSTPH